MGSRYSCWSWLKDRLWPGSSSRKVEVFRSPKRWPSPGSRIFYGQPQRGILQRPANGTNGETLLLRQAERPTSVSPDGSYLLYTDLVGNGASTRYDLWGVSLAAEAKPAPVVSDVGDQTQAMFSPNGRWIAYVSNEAGAEEVYVREFSLNKPGKSPPHGGSVLVSKGSGSSPRWPRDGKELFYLSSDGNVMAVDVKTDGVFEAGPPRVLFPAPTALPDWSVTADGQRFLFAVRTNETSPAAFTVDLNWQARLNR